jgi:uncharacterized protein YfbU (UPF0304 family)
VINKLKEARERSGFSQAELAKAAEVSRQVISAIESNQQSPSLKLALRLASLLNVKIENVFSDDEKHGFYEEQEVLTKQQRLSLMNQYSILTALSKVQKDDDMSKHYEYLSAIFQNGYTHLYYEATDNMQKELPTTVSEEVLSILDLHRTLLWSLGPDPKPEELKAVKFLGFDANNEGEYLMFAKFYQNDPSGPRYGELNIFNSHHRTLERYRRMLAEWGRMKRKPQLSSAQIQQILDAGTFR